MTRMQDLEKRLDRLDGKPREADAAQEFWRGVVEQLTADERLAFARVLKDSHQENHSPDDEAWLSTRPQDQQAVVRKVFALYKKLASD